MAPKIIKIEAHAYGKDIDVNSHVQNALFPHERLNYEKMVEALRKAKAIVEVKRKDMELNPVLFFDIVRFCEFHCMDLRFAGEHGAYQHHGATMDLFVVAYITKHAGGFHSPIFAKVAGRLAFGLWGDDGVFLHNAANEASDAT